MKKNTMLAVLFASALLIGYGISSAKSSVTSRKFSDDPVLGGKLPKGYRDWKFISVAHEAGKLNDLRVVLGNDIAVNAFRQNKRPFPDGSIIVRLAWEYDSSALNNKVFGQPQSFVPGRPKEGIQFMVKDSKKYAVSQGWGYAQFDNGVSLAKGLITKCASCHLPANENDYVFTRYAQ